MDSARPDLVCDADLLAWDFMRMNTVASWAYGACLIDREEAWALMVEAAQSIQLSFSSFPEIGRAYVRAKQQVIPEDEPRETEAVVDALLGEGGAWRDLVWEVPLTGVRPPDDRVRTCEVATGTALAYAIASAFQDEYEREGTTLRLLLSPGTYAGPITVQGSIEMEAPDGDVVLEGPGTDEFVLKAEGNAGLIVRGITIRTTKADEGSDALGVGEAFVRLEHCDVSAGDCAVTLFNDGVLHVISGRIHSSARGIGVDEGHVQARDVRFESTSEAAMVGCDEATADVFGCHFACSAGGGVHLFQESTVRRSVFEDLGLPAVGLAEDSLAIVEECQFLGGQCGVLAEAPSQLRVSRCTFRQQRGFGVDLDQAKVGALIEDCEFTGSAPGTILLRPGTGAVVRACRFSDAAGAAVEVNGGGSRQPLVRAPRIVNCEVATSQGGAVLVHSGAAAHVHGLVARSFARPALESRDEGSRLMANRCTLASASAAASLVWKGGLAVLEDCVFRELDANAVDVLEGGQVHADRCSMSTAHRALEVEGASRARLVDCTLGPCRGAALGIFGESSVWMSGGTLRASPPSDDGEDTLHLQEGATAVFESVGIEGACQLSGATALFARCELGPSTSVAIAANDGARAMIHCCRLHDGAWSAVEVGADASVHLVDSDVNQSAGQTGLLSTGGRIEMAGGRLVGGSQSIAVARNAGQIALLSVACEQGAGGRFDEEDGGRVLTGARSFPLRLGRGGLWIGRLAVPALTPEGVRRAQFALSLHFGREDAAWIAPLDKKLGLCAPNQSDLAVAMHVVAACFRRDGLASVLEHATAAGGIAGEARRDPPARSVPA